MNRYNNFYKNRKNYLEIGSKNVTFVIKIIGKGKMLSECIGIGGTYVRTSIEDFIQWFNVVKPLNESQENINNFFDLLKRFDDNEFYTINIICGSSLWQDEDVTNPECFFRIKCINKWRIKNASLEILNNKNSDNEKYLILNYKKK